MTASTADLIVNAADLLSFAFDLGVRWGQSLDGEMREAILTQFAGCHMLAHRLYPPGVSEQMADVFAAGQRAGERWRKTLVVTREGPPPHRPVKRIKGKRRLIRRRSGA